MNTSDNQYSVRDVARIFGLNESRIRYWAQTGFINPSGSRAGKRVYTFRDLVSVKAAKELLERGIPLQRVRRNIQALREALPQLEEPLTRLRVCSDGEHLLVDGSGGTFEALSGQRLLDFAIDDLQSTVAEVLQLRAPAAVADPGAATPAQGGVVETAAASPAPPAPGAPERPSTAYGWFLRGCALDCDGTVEPHGARAGEAIAAYQRAIELDPGLAAAQTNLGNLLYARGEREAARRSYEMACALEPEQAQARYNLANLYEEEGDLEMAAAEYRRALVADPALVDAHFNLALTLEALGSRVQAVEHWSRFVEGAREATEVDRQSVRHARARLSELAGQVGGASGGGGQDTTSSGS